MLSDRPPSVPIRPTSTPTAVGHLGALRLVQLGVRTRHLHLDGRAMNRRIVIAALITAFGFGLLIHTPIDTAARTNPPPITRCAGIDSANHLYDCQEIPRDR